MMELQTIVIDSRKRFPGRPAAASVPHDPDDAPAGLSIGVSTLRAFLTGARAAGLNVDEVLARANVISSAATYDREHLDRVPVKQWARLVQHLQHTMNDEAVGLLARPLPLGTFLMVCRAFIHCTTLGDAVRRFVHFQNLLQIGISYEIEESAKSVHVRLRPTTAGAVKHPIFADFALLGFHRLFSWLTSELIELDQLYIGPPAPEYTDAFTDLFFQTPVHYDQGYYGLSFSRTYLSLPITRSEEELETFTQRFPTGIFLPIQRSGSLSLSLRAFLVEELKYTGRMPTAEDCALHFGLVHSQSFCRRLRQEGMRFQDIKSHARRDVAMYHLSRTALSMEKIAEHAGFSEASAFSRAFKGWTKMTPLAYRKAMTKQ